jgi:hypothetical protein
MGHVRQNEDGKQRRVFQDGSRRSSRCKPGDWNFGGAQAGIRCLGKENRVGESAPIAGKALLLPLSADRRRSGGRKGKRNERERNGDGKVWFSVAEVGRGWMESTVDVGPETRRTTNFWMAIWGLLVGIAQVVLWDLQTWMSSDSAGHGQQWFKLFETYVLLSALRLVMK